MKPSTPEGSPATPASSPQLAEQRLAEQQLAKLPQRDQQLVRQCMVNHDLTLAEALDALREFGAL